jgi:hypothetical protein
MKYPPIKVWFGTLEKIITGWKSKSPEIVFMVTGGYTFLLKKESKSFNGFVDTFKPFLND